MEGNAMMEGLGQCKQLVGSSQFTSMLVGNIENICKCFDNDAQQEGEKCDCSAIIGNEKFTTAIGEFQTCHGTATDLQSSMASNFKYITKDCYRKSLRSILDSVENNYICGVDISSLKEKGEKMLIVMDAVGGTVNGAFELLDKVKNIFYDGKSFFSKLIINFPGYNILYPVGVVVFILMVVIGIFYSIFKLFRCIFCPSRKENDEINNEQMKYLQEQYNRTLQTSAQLNNYLIGYQNA
ncbi:hypothetical protein POVWA2_074120 [Plasmodium ovale wallikeri]|uniref:Uncharacterized protein n=1 Tax=Plasmodium ovale wallikeri TaxID=864142 RepID=A0A1A9AIV8_PLAOA|nr:hypothetical protein POVWA1_068810 [Plasmodium ovale wallikeri]SBT56548.1 hypothetical protein POVWA2_074120 [Plasmodium ovale wallikeri]